MFIKIIGSTPLLNEKNMGMNIYKMKAQKLRIKQHSQSSELETVLITRTVSTWGRKSPGPRLPARMHLQPGSLLRPTLHPGPGLLTPFPDPITSQPPAKKKAHFVRVQTLPLMVSFQASVSSSLLWAQLCCKHGLRSSYSLSLELSDPKFWGNRGRQKSRVRLSPCSLETMKKKQP